MWWLDILGVFPIPKAIIMVSTYETTSNIIAAPRAIDILTPNLYADLVSLPRFRSESLRTKK